MFLQFVWNALRLTMTWENSCAMCIYNISISNIGKRFKNRTMPVISAGLPSAIYLTVPSHLPGNADLFSLQNSATLFPLLQGKTSGITCLLPATNAVNVYI